MIALNNVATANDYTAANTRLQPGTERVNVVVTNAAAYLQLCDDRGNFGASDESFLTPGKYSFDRKCGGGRLRSGAVGVPARVTLELVRGDEIPGA